MQEKVWFYLFDVREFLSQREPVGLVDVLTWLRQQNLEQTTRTVNTTRLRTEAIELRNGIWLADFTKLRRTRGPGRAGQNTPAQGFQLNENEDFSEATSLLYNPEKQLAIIEYNHHGVRRGTIAGYLAETAAILAEEANYYAFNPRFDDGARERFEKRRATRKIEARIHPRELNEHDYREGGMVRDAVRQGLRTDSTVVAFEVSLGRAKGFLGGQVNADVEELFELAKNEHEGLKRLNVRFQDEDQVMETVDLVAERTRLGYTLPVSPQDRQIPKAARWEALERALRQWS